MHQNSKSRAATSLSSCTERKVTSCPYGRRNHPNLLRHWHLGSAAKWPRPGPPTTIHHASGISGSSHSFIEVSRVKVLVGHQSCSSRFHNRIPKGKERGERERERGRGSFFKRSATKMLETKLEQCHFGCECLPTYHLQVQRSKLEIYFSLDI